MSYDAYLKSTDFDLAENVTPEQVEGLIQQVMDDHPVRLDEASWNGSAYCLDMDVTNVGQSFRERVDKLCQAMGTLVAVPFEVLVRDDSMNDERDSYHYGGPSQADVDRFRENCQLDRALTELLGSGPKVTAARHAVESIRNEPASQKASQIVVITDGGVIQNVMASTPGIEVTILDYDLEGHEIDPTIRKIAQDYGPPKEARVFSQFVEVDEDRIAEIFGSQPLVLYAYAQTLERGLAGMFDGGPGRDFTPDWIVNGAVAFEVVAGHQPRIAYDAMTAHADMMSFETFSELVKSVHAFAKDEDAVAGAERLKTLLEASPWRVEEGGVVPKESSGSAYPREGRP